MFAYSVLICRRSFELYSLLCASMANSGRRVPESSIYVYKEGNVFGRLPALHYPLAALLEQ